jgi:hypothetical protein
MSGRRPRAATSVFGQSRGAATQCHNDACRSRPDGRRVRKPWFTPRSVGRGGKYELHRAARRVTPGQGDLTESGTENTPPQGIGVRVKWCGKSAPRSRQREWQAKPRAEQDQIGWRYQGGPPEATG